MIMDDNYISSNSFLWCETQLKQYLKKELEAEERKYKSPDVGTYLLKTRRPV